MDSLSLGVIGGVSGVVLVAGGMKLYVLGYQHAMEYADLQLEKLQLQFEGLRKVHERVGPPTNLPCAEEIYRLLSKGELPWNVAEDAAINPEGEQTKEVEQLEGWWKVEGGEGQ